ncbi:MAG: hypothetical protein K2F70_05160, partial [Muribaculaceae bacterium]|nr:hypothetical protein [Muribaculaceae bacterium]
MEQPYSANMLIVKIVGMLPGASAEYRRSLAEYTGLCGCSMEQPYRANTKHIKNRTASIFDTAPTMRSVRCKKKL